MKTVRPEAPGHNAAIGAMAIDDVDPEDLINPDETARLLGLRPATLTAWRHEKRGPPYVKIGRKVQYVRSKIPPWLGQRIRVSATA